MKSATLAGIFLAALGIVSLAYRGDRLHNGEESCGDWFIACDREPETSCPAASRSGGLSLVGGIACWSRREGR
jgi:hypothetical protein